MTISRKFTMWMIVNGLFVCALYIALWQAIDWLSVVVIAFVWFVLAANAIAYFRRTAKEYREPAPHWLGYLVDALVLYALLAHAWYLTTFAYLAGAVLLFLVYRHSEKQSTKEPKPKTGPIIEKETALPLSGDSSLTESADRERYQEIVFAFSDLVAANAPLIGDCSVLPHPKRTILYAIKWVMEDYETKRDTATDPALREAYDKMLPTLSYLLTRLARDWQEIDSEDRDAIAKLRGCEAFPDWALPLKQKYIDDEKASTEAAEVAFQVMKDKVDRGKAVRG